jgi:hypothetical protein
LKDNWVNYKEDNQFILMESPLTSSLLYGELFATADSASMSKLLSTQLTGVG